MNTCMYLVSQLNQLTSSNKLTAKVATVTYLMVIIWKANSGGSEDNSGSNGLSELFETWIVVDDIIRNATSVWRLDV